MTRTIFNFISGLLYNVAESSFQGKLSICLGALKWRGYRKRSIIAKNVSFGFLVFTETCRRNPLRSIVEYIHANQTMQYYAKRIFLTYFITMKQLNSQLGGCASVCRCQFSVKLSVQCTNPGLDILLSTLIHFGQLLCFTQLGLNIVLE